MAPTVDEDELTVEEVWAYTATIGDFVDSLVTFALETASGEAAKRCKVAMAEANLRAKNGLWTFAGCMRSISSQWMLAWKQDKNECEIRFKTRRWQQKSVIRIKKMLKHTYLLENDLNPDQNGKGGPR
ncbi:uncharacterized protein PHALS_01933 [Plasmopara halstedii]|uniref:Uncharacterized protein n=1 Tax=Plasmopara halstedii TaxID=4781 RepID=A0A0P1AVX5_PLAHL|nr:uncharacterized protein PHALS_01933 [Plasmopara halstedii]CEG45650.1 hypothetical protein PHALS_01933 [Plasmopara halstedii]|eukprot:XP_024582019.1 hypothetical protein PHALS_01933 [Plasmopara halstedii]